MAATIRQIICLLLIIVISGAESARSTGYDDDIDIGVQRGGMIKMLREMVHQANATGADSLNLPANATSIRENITDTFSCENRTYGYYADVDNDCQIFHVCLPSQSASGRNVTYKWSFICPNETIFNQEVMVCTRPEDAIDCENSQMYYDKNNEFGKVNNTMTAPNSNSTEAPRHKPNYVTNNNAMKRKDVKRKQNIVMAENMMMDDDDMEEMMADGMAMDKENDNMMMDKNGDHMKIKEVKRKQNVAMAEGVKEIMVEGMMTDDMKEMMMNMMINANNMPEGMNKKPPVTITPNAFKKPLIEPTKTQNAQMQNSKKQQTSGNNKKGVGHRKPIAEKTKKEKELSVEENNKKQMPVTNIELTGLSDIEPSVAVVASDFGTYSPGYKVESPIEVINDRISLERGFNSDGKRLKKRGAFRFKADV